MNRFPNVTVNWLRAGYPDGVPQNDYLPLFALLSGQLSADIERVRERLAARRWPLDDPRETEDSPSDEDRS